MNNIFILYECDEQKWLDSMKVIATTTDREALLEFIGDKIMAAEMHYGGKTALPGYDELENDRKNCCVDFGRLDFGFVEEKENICTAAKDLPLSNNDIEAAVKQEFMRRLKAEGYNFINADEHNPDKIFKDGQEIIMFDEENNMLYKPERRDEAHELSRIRSEVREYVTSYLAAKTSGEKAAENFYTLSSWNRYVLAASQYKDNSFMFVTWQKSAVGNGYVYGNYYRDFAAAKESFALRAGLINETKLFSETELTVIRSNLSDFLNLDSGTYLDFSREKAIEGVINKIDEIIAPEIAEQQEEHESEGYGYEPEQ